MSRYPRGVCCAGVIALIAAASASGQTTFSYSDNFNADPVNALPPGWASASNGLPTPDASPRVSSADPAGWGVACTAGTSTPAGCGLLGILQDYTVPWSGGQRFSLMHPGLAPGAGGWSTVAWYAGTDAIHTGSYPMLLQTNRMKVAFDMIVRSGDARCGTTPADGGVFAVQPVGSTIQPSDLNRVGAAGGGEGWGGLGGFAVEFDIYDNGGANDPAGTDAANHIGLDAYLKWTGGDQLPSVITNVDLIGQGVIPRFVQVGDNNQPLHITVFYNDDRLAGGGLGIVQVYLKVDPATYPGSGGTGSAIAFGDTSTILDPDSGSVLGTLVLQACVGDWPTTGAIFGFTASTGGCNSVYQIDNVAAQTQTVAPGTACTVTGLPTFDPGELVNLDAGGAESGATAADLTAPGWDVAIYPTFADGLDAAKGSIAFDVANGLRYKKVTGEPDLNYNDDGAGSACVAGGDRYFPGLAGGGHDHFATVATGWIYFAPDDGSTPYPRSYSLELGSDDGFEVLFGTGKTNQVVKNFTGGRGCPGSVDAASTFNLIVPAPGVYAIQIIHFEQTGGGNLEFFRRFKTDSLLLIPQSQLVGASTGPYSDQPLVYGKYKGNVAPNLISTYTPITLPMVTLSPTQKLAGTGTGSQVFDVKTVQANFPGIDIHANREDSGDINALAFADALGNRAPGATSATINFRGPGAENEGGLPNGVDFPGLPSHADQFVFRAQGYAVFSAPGLYLLGSDSDDDAWLRFGNQTVFSTGCCPNQTIPLNVTEPGTYPIRVEQIEGGGDARIKLYQFVTDVGIVPVNGAGSTVQVFQSVTGTPFAWKSNGWTLGADRKVANVGQGGTPGWNAILAKLPAIPGVDLSENPGLASAIIENDLVGVGTGLAAQAFDSPDWINYADIGESGGNFGGDRSTASFLKTDSTPLFTAGGNDDFAISSQGYIEFPAAGDYALGTNGDDGLVMWVGGKVVTIFPYNTGPADNTPAIIHVDNAGIYDIRCDWFERGGGAEVEIFQYLPDGATRVLVNDPAATVKVYRTLAVAPAVDLHNPVTLPASLKVAAIDRGGDLGARVRLVNATFIGGNGDGGLGHDKLRSLQQATELLDSVTGDGPVSYNEYGTLVADVTAPVINFGDGTFPGPVNADDYAMRATGVLALTKGGHLFEVASDDGFTMRMGSRVVGQSGALKGAGHVRFYVKAPEDGLYPFTLDWFERGGGNSIYLAEYVVSGGAFTLTNLNEGAATKMYVGANPCPTPFADSNLDGDVDQVDFGIFQACYTGELAPPTLPAECKCFDQDRNGTINSQDYAKFAACVTGPSIQWSQALTPDCVP